MRCKEEDEMKDRMGWSWMLLGCQVFGAAAEQCAKRAQPARSCYRQGYPLTIESQPREPRGSRQSRKPRSTPTPDSPPPRRILSTTDFSNALCSFNVASPPIPGPPAPTPRSAGTPVFEPA
jgi:hypothetical protein